MGIVRYNKLPIELIHILGKNRECFLCGELIGKDENIVYWVGFNSTVILLHKHCASSLACHLISDFSRLNVNENSNL